MKRIIAAIIFGLVLGAVAAHGQFVPPSVGSYKSDGGGGWTPLLSSASSNPLSFSPPPAALYCFNTGINQWVPADSSCFGGSGSGTVTSVALVGSNTFFSSTPGTAVTNSGTLNVDDQLSTQVANCMFAGPTTGAAATPSCRALVNADFPNTLAPVFSGANLTSLPAQAFSGLTGGTNTAAAMVVGSGASLAASGTGTIVATSTTTIPGAINPQTATYQVLASDFSGYKTITVASGTFTITLVASGTQPAAGQYINILNYGNGVVTIARSGQNINGGTTSIVLGFGTSTTPSYATIWSDGTNYFSTGLYQIVDVNDVRLGNSAATIDTLTGGVLKLGRSTQPISAGLDFGSAATAWARTYSSGFISVGTKFTASGCTSITTTVGGATAGKFTIGGNACTVVITMNGATGLTAPNGYSCHANDVTTAAGNTGMYFSANSATTATLTVPATAAASDVIDFNCMAF